MSRAAFGLCCLPALLAACSTSPSWIPSPNFDQRHPVLVIIHHTGDDSLERARKVLTDPATKVSAHYLIDRDGRQLQLVAESDRAWHAGAARWGAIEDVNSASIGIELVNDGAEPFPEPQIRALLVLLAELKQRHHLPTEAFIGHADVAPRRKADPSQYFPWRTLAEQGFGRWCFQPSVSVSAAEEAVQADTVSAGDLLGLRALGYEISDPAATVKAFRRHFLAQEGPAQFSAPERAVLDCLLQAPVR